MGFDNSQVFQLPTASYISWD